MRDIAVVCRLSANGYFCFAREINHPCVMFLEANCRYVFARSRGRLKFPTLTIAQVLVSHHPSRYLQEPKCTFERAHDFHPIQGNSDCLKLFVQELQLHMHISILEPRGPHLRDESANLLQALQQVAHTILHGFALGSKHSRLLQNYLGPFAARPFAEHHRYRSYDLPSLCPRYC